MDAWIGGKIMFFFLVGLERDLLTRLVLGFRRYRQKGAVLVKARPAWVFVLGGVI